MRIPLMRAWTQLSGQVTIGWRRASRRSSQTDEKSIKYVEPVSSKCVMLCMSVCENVRSSMLILLIESMCSQRYGFKVRCDPKEK